MDEVYSRNTQTAVRDSESVRCFSKFTKGAIHLNGLFDGEPVKRKPDKKTPANKIFEYS
jgi:hypothetical protein